MKIFKTKFFSLDNLRTPLYGRVESSLRTSVITSAATTGILPSQVDINKVTTGYVDPVVSGLAAQMDPFTLTLEPIPSSITDLDGNKRATDLNDAKARDYAKAQFYKVYAAPAGSADSLFEVSGVAGVQPYPNSQWWSDAPKLFARGKYKGFLDAVRVGMQNKRELDQQVSGLDLTPAEFNSVKIDLSKRSYILSHYSGKTSSRDYINNTPKAQKVEDANELARVLNSNNGTLSQIVALSYPDLPLLKYKDVIQNFERNPNLGSNKDAVKAALVNFKNELISQYRKDNKVSLADLLSKYA